MRQLSVDGKELCDSWVSILRKEQMDDFDSSLGPKLKPAVSEKLLRRNAERLLAD